MAPNSLIFPHTQTEKKNLEDHKPKQVITNSCVSFHLLWVITWMQEVKRKCHGQIGQSKLTSECDMSKWMSKRERERERGTTITMSQTQCFPCTYTLVSTCIQEFRMRTSKKNITFTLIYLCTINHTNRIYIYKKSDEMQFIFPQRTTSSSEHRLLNVVKREKEREGRKFIRMELNVINKSITLFWRC